MVDLIQNANGNLVSVYHYRYHILGLHLLLPGQLLIVVCPHLAMYYTIWIFCSVMQLRHVNNFLLNQGMLVSYHPLIIVSFDTVKLILEN